MKVLFVDHTAELGGAEIMLEIMATGLSSLGVETHVALGSTGPLAGRLRAAGISVHHVPLGAAAKVHRRGAPVDARLVLDSFRWVRSLRELALDLNIDVLITNSQKAHVLGAVVARLSHLPLVWRLHDIVGTTTFGPAQRTALRFAASIGRPRVLCVSQAVVAAARTHIGLRNLICLHNGVDIERLRPRDSLDLRAHFGWRPETVLVGTIGRLVRWKGCMVLVEVARLLAESAPLVRFVLVGDELIDADDGFRRALRLQIEESGVGDRVGMFPFTDDVGAVLDDLDVLAQPSLEPDPFPTSVVEAAVMGVPIVAFDHGGIREIIRDDHHGLLVKPGDVAKFSDACRRAAMEPALRKSLATATRQDSERLTADRMCREIRSELDAIVGHHARR